jgi:nucleoside-diphosphate-sugar epimerase
MKKKILITGASGFIGSFLVEEALRRGEEVWAGVRANSSRRYLTDPRIHFATLDLSDETRLRTQLEAYRSEMGSGWDLIIHAAGVTKCRKAEEFMEGNYHATRHLVDALIALQMQPAQFFYLSSLSVLGPLHEADGRPFTEDDEPRPNTAYGRSKRAAEEYLQSLPGFRSVIFRPTGVYGPREKDYFLMARTIQRHLDFSVGYQPQALTFIYVTDLVRALFSAYERGLTRGCFLLSDGNTYSSAHFSDLLRDELGVRGVLHITAPLWFLRLVCAVSQTLSGWVGKASTLNRDKYQIMKQRNWQCNITPARDELLYQPKYPLERGVRDAIAWYKQEKWL